MESNLILEDGEEGQMIALMNDDRHPYLSGNFAPIKRELPLTQCKIVEGQIPIELSGGQYVRNGGNPMKDEDETRDFPIL